MRFFTSRFIQTAGKKTHVLKVTNFMNNLENTELLTFYTCFEVLGRALSQYQLKIIEAWHISCKKQ